MKTTPHSETKKCSRCPAVLPNTKEHFYTYPTGKFYAHCKTCHKGICTLYQQKNESQIHDVLLQKKYGINRQEYTELLEAQGGGCAICGITATEQNRKLAVDHDHKTGMVRGLLCHRHNVGLGQFQDDPDLLRKAIDYLT